MASPTDMPDADTTDSTPSHGEDSSNGGNLGFGATWSMAAGGMVGGGIFSVLGVIVGVAGAWTWLSFVIAGLIALATSLSYVRLAAAYGEGGGAFTFLREINAKGFAGSLSWVLVVGYTLTMGVYAATFGHYGAYALGLGVSGWAARVGAVALVGVIIGINLRGTGSTARVETVIVWGNLILLIGLSAFGMAEWSTDQLTAGLEPVGWTGALVGAATIFMSYEGFQLLAYDYGEISRPKKTLQRAVPLAVVFVIGVYVAVALGATMLVGAGTLQEHSNVALSVAGEAALGAWGLWLVTLAAACATAAAVNSTLFATARLAKRVADDGELPAIVDHTNGAGVPDRALIGIGAGAAVLAVIGSLSTLVEAASLAFLFTFAVVNVLAFRHLDRGRWISAAGALGAAAATLLLVWRFAHRDPIALGFLAGVVLLATAGRHLLLARMRTKTSD